MSPFMHHAIILLFIFFSVSMGNDDREYAKVCSFLYSCGNVKDIGYPFWGDARPNYCGIQEFKLNCDDQSVLYPKIWRVRFTSTAFREGYMVHSINTTRSTMAIARQDEQCLPLEKQDINKNEQTPLRLGAGVANLSLFYDCASNVSNLGSFSCSNSTNITMYYSNQPREIGKCRSNVTFPVSKRALDEFIGNQNNRTLQSVLEEEFEVNFNSIFTECLKCQNSGGVCGTGTNPSGFRCYRLGKKKSWLGLFLGLGITTGGIMLIIGVVSLCLKKQTTIKFYLLWKGKETTYQKNMEACLKLQGSLAPRRYTYANILKMTHSFREKLGEGGYAVVYKGELSDGQLVAVKLLKKSKGTWYKGEDFINEVVSMGRTNHVNIITLLGFCFDRNQRALVFEFMSNGSLDKFTHNTCHKSLPWKTIFDIAIEIGRGLEYLHRGCNTTILHFDIKPHNILLNKNFRPKISDFGLARLCASKETTTISTLEARGTVGYIAPEVFCRNFGGVSHKSDVYSYGMMVLDLACGRKNKDEVEGDSDGLSFGEWIYERIEGRKEIDGSMSDEEKELRMKMILVSLWCIQTYPLNRPSISKAVEMMEGCIELIKVPPKPFLCSPPTVTFDSSFASNDFHTLE